MTWTRPRDEYGRAYYAQNEVPPADEAFAHWLGKLTHPSAVVTNLGHRHKCIGGWVESGEWWLHCGVCRPARNDGRDA